MTADLALTRMTDAADALATAEITYLVDTAPAVKSLNDAIEAALSYADTLDFSDPSATRVERAAWRFGRIADAAHANRRF